MGICDLLFWLLFLELVCIHYSLSLPVTTNTDATTGLVHILSSGFPSGNISQSVCRYFPTEEFIAPTMRLTRQVSFGVGP